MLGSRRQPSVILIIVASWVAVCSALPLPHPQLSESEFRSFPDDMEDAGDNKVAIYGGYSRIARYGRGFSFNPRSFNHAFTVKNPYELDPRNSVIQRQTYGDDKAPFFDLDKMLAEQAAIEAKIEAVNRAEVEREAAEKEKMRKEEEEEMAMEMEMKMVMEAEKMVAEEVAKEVETAIDEVVDDAVNAILGEEDAEKVVEELKELEEKVIDAAAAATITEDGEDGATEVDILIEEVIPEGSETEEEEETTEEEEESQAETTEEDYSDSSSEKEGEPPKEVDLGSVQEV